MISWRRGRTMNPNLSYGMHSEGTRLSCGRAFSQMSWFLSLSEPSLPFAGSASVSLLGFLSVILLAHRLWPSPYSNTPAFWCRSPGYSRTQSRFSPFRCCQMQADINLNSRWLGGKIWPAPSMTCSYFLFLSSLTNEITGMCCCKIRQGQGAGSYLKRHFLKKQWSTQMERWRFVPGS